MLNKLARSAAPVLRPSRATPLVGAARGRALSMSPILRQQGEITREAIETPLSLWNFTEEENMLRETGTSSSLVM